MVADYHLSVLQKETIQSLISENAAIKEEMVVFSKLNHPLVFVDCTLGGGGHFLSLLQEIQTQALLFPEKEFIFLGFDRDSDAISHVQKKLSSFSFAKNISVELHHQKFSEVESVLHLKGFKYIYRLLADFGVSSYQLDNGKRGFSIRNDGPLDMRMDQADHSTLTAKEIIESYSERDLLRIFREFGEMKGAYSLSKTIVKDRELGKIPLESSMQFAEYVKKNISFKKDKIHPATQVFQALRIEINTELKEIMLLLKRIPQFFSPVSKFGFITFHSLEDRIVKKFMRAWEKGVKNLDNIKESDEILFSPSMLTSLGRENPRGGVVASTNETENNPRARSARLRVFESAQI